MYFWFLFIVCTLVLSILLWFLLYLPAGLWAGSPSAHAIFSSLPFRVYIRFYFQAACLGLILGQVISPPWYYGHFGLDYFLLWGLFFALWACQQHPWPQLSRCCQHLPQLQQQKNLTRLCQMSLGLQNCPGFRTTDIGLKKNKNFLYTSSFHFSDILGRWKLIYLLIFFCFGSKAYS